jgi:hypothetical protein
MTLLTALWVAYTAFVTFLAIVFYKDADTDRRLSEHYRNKWIEATRKRHS